MRGNGLPYELESNIEYLIHGKFKRTEDDLNGVFGAWWVPLEQLEFQIRAEALDAALVDYENVMRDARINALDYLARARAANEGGAGPP